MSEPKDQLSDRNDQDSSTVSNAGYHQFINGMNCLNRRIIKNLCFTSIYKDRVKRYCYLLWEQSLTVQNSPRRATNKHSLMKFESNEGQMIPLRSFS